MGKNQVHCLIEPAQATPIWFLYLEDILRKSCQKKHLSLIRIDNVQMLDQLAEKPITVLVVCSQNNWAQHVVNELQRRHIMPVLLGVEPTLFGETVSGITIARRIFIEKVMDYFLNCGKKRMALVGVNRNASNDNVKVETFIQNSKDMHLPASLDDVYFTDSDIVNCVTKCLNQASRYDGIICSNDYIAANLLAQAHGRGIRVPEDLFVIGLGYTLIGQYTKPTLTTTTYDEFYEMGRQAINIWHIFSSNPSLASIIISVNTEIIPRGSTAFIQPPKKEPLPADSTPPSLPIGSNSQIIRNLENCLRNCDDLDIQILHAILTGQSNEQIESSLFLAHSSLQYRLKRIYRLVNVEHRSELEKLFQYYLPNFLSSAPVRSTFLRQGAVTGPVKGQEVKPCIRHCSPANATKT